MSRWVLGVVLAWCLVGLAPGVAAADSVRETAAEVGAAVVKPVAPPPAASTKKTYPLAPDKPATLKPVLPANAGGGDTASQAFVIGDRYTIAGVNWATIRNAPGDLVIGNAGRGWSLDATRATDSWRFGYTYNGFSGCGWIVVSNLDNPPGTGNVYCPTADGSSISRSAVAVTWNGRTNCQPDGSCDGSGVRMTGCSSATGFRNVRPWLRDQTGQNAGPQIERNQLVFWRYKTPDSRWVMVRNDRVATGDGNWQFVARKCFGALPNERSINTN